MRWSPPAARNVRSSSVVAKSAALCSATTVSRTVRQSTSVGTVNHPKWNRPESWAKRVDNRNQRTSRTARWRTKKAQNQTKSKAIRSTMRPQAPTRAAARVWAIRTQLRNFWTASTWSGVQAAEYWSSKSKMAAVITWPVQSAAHSSAGFASRKPASFTTSARPAAPSSANANGARKRRWSGNSACYLVRPFSFCSVVCIWGDLFGGVAATCLIKKFSIL